MTDNTKTSGGKRKGLILTLPGAPRTPHRVEGVPGLYCPHHPTPVSDGHPQDINTTEAKRADADLSVPLKLVEFDAGEVADLRERCKAHHEDARHGLLAHQRNVVSQDELEAVRDESKALRNS